MRRLLVCAVLGAVLMASGCSSTDKTSTGPAVAGSTPGSTSGSTAGSGAGTGTTAKTNGTAAPAGGEYCDVVERINKDTKKDGSAKKVTQAEIDAVIAQMRVAQDAAPAELNAAWDTVIDVVEELGKLEVTGESETTKAFALVFDPVFMKAADDLSAYTKKQCGFGLEGFDEDGGSNGSNESNEKPTSTIGGGDDDAAGLPEACSRLTTLSDDDAQDPTSLYSVRKAVCLASPTASWLKVVISGSAWSSMNGTDWTVTVPTDSGNALSAADALAACSAIDSYLSGVGTDAKITIGIGEVTEADVTTVLASKDPAGTCAAR